MSFNFTSNIIQAMNAMANIETERELGEQTKQQKALAEKQAESDVGIAEAEKAAAEARVNGHNNEKSDRHDYLHQALVPKNERGSLDNFDPSGYFNEQGVVKSKNLQGGASKQEVERVYREWWKSDWAGETLEKELEAKQAVLEKRQAYFNFIKNGGAGGKN